MYQVRVYTKGKIEVFQNVTRHFFRHNVLYVYFTDDMDIPSLSASIHLKDIYELKVVQEPEFTPEGPRPEDVEIIIY